jgi:hypothetical protein
LLPNQVEGEPGIRTYFDLIDHVISKTANALKNEDSRSVDPAHGLMGHYFSGE